MLFTATHPDLAAGAVIETDDADCARAIAADEFGHQLRLPADEVHGQISVACCD